MLKINYEELVPSTGLEPVSHMAENFKFSVSTDFTNWAYEVVALTGF